MIAATFLLGPLFASAAGPRWVAGASYFSPSAKGNPVIWSNGQVRYYVDQGPLSATVSNAQANAMIASAAAVWSDVPTAAVAVTLAGSLSEDVSGANVTAGSAGLALPADIQPSAVATPVGIVYDLDGSVIDAFFGAGASAPSLCQQTGVYALVDNMTTSGNLAHALMLVNGLCATNATQLAVLQYQLVRGFGRILGLDWSQANEEDFATAQETSADLAGWPILHPIERLCHASGESCIPNGTQLRFDDIAALNRLYPVTAQNLASFNEKQITASNTLSIRGTITFKNGQGMQGVNVVLRPIDPGTQLPDVRYTATAVSGAYFQGNAGNDVTGLHNAASNPPAAFGSDDPTLEGYFDLSGVPLPPGQTAADYQLTFEAMNPLDTAQSSVGPYILGQVAPSGTMPTLSLSQLQAGTMQSENVVIDDSAGASFSGDDGSEAAPAQLPPSGEWTARLTGYGHTSWFQWHPQANREFTMEAQALDETGQPTNNKADPLLGLWNGTDPATTPPAAFTLQALNTPIAGLTTLAAITTSATEVRLGIADARGDGRPDYLYRGRILYADSVAPPRLPAGGGPIVIHGLGFRANSVVTVNGAQAAVTSVSPNEITAMAPASGGFTGSVQVQVQDPQTLGFTIIADGLSYSAQNGDVLTILAAPSGPQAVGVPQPFTVRAMNWDDEWPAANIPVTYTVASGSATLGCSQPTCTVTTAQNGVATLMVSATSSALTQITASLTSGASLAAEFSGTPAAAISALTPALYLAIGGTAQWSPQALTQSNGTPVAAIPVTWSSTDTHIAVPAAPTLSSSQGIAAQQITAGPFISGEVAIVDACLPGNAACAGFSIFAVHLETAALSPLSGDSQLIAAGQNFTPVTLEVTDAIGHPIAGAPVTFYQSLYAWTPPCPSIGPCSPAPLLAQTQTQASSSSDGSVSVTPVPLNGQPGRLTIIATVGSAASFECQLESHP